MSRFLINEADPTVAKGSSSHLAVEPGVSPASRVGDTVRIEGEIYSQQDMLVDGEIAGSVMLPHHTLTIGAKANVKASIKAKTVVLLGTVEGTIEASERIELRSCCSLLGDIRSPRIMVADGAYIKGTIEVGCQDAGDSSPTPALKAFAAALSSFDEAAVSVDAHLVESAAVREEQQERF